jgi:hypothetical protein
LRRDRDNTRQPYCAEGGGTESTYTLHQRPNGQWQVTTKCGGTLAHTAGRYVSATPRGPWTWQALLPTCSDLHCYLTGAAASVPTTNGMLLLQWSRSEPEGSIPWWSEVPR